MDRTNSSCWSSGSAERLLTWQGGHDRTIVPSTDVVYLGLTAMLLRELGATRGAPSKCIKKEMESTREREKKKKAGRWCTRMMDNINGQNCVGGQQEQQHEILFEMEGTRSCLVAATDQSASFSECGALLRNVSPIRANVPSPSGQRHRSDDTCLLPPLAGARCEMDAPPTSGPLEMTAKGRAGKEGGEGNEEGEREGGAGGMFGPLAQTSAGTDWSRALSKSSPVSSCWIGAFTSASS